MNILLDLDGTLTDPAPGFINSLHYAFETLDIVLPSDAQLATHIGPPLEQTIDHLLGPSKASLRDTMIMRYRQRYSTQGLFENSVYAGVDESLEALKRNGSRLFLATAKPRVIATQILQHFELAPYFSGIYGSEFDGTRSYKADLLQFLMQQETLRPEECVMVGDRGHDMIAAIKNQVAAVGVLWGYGSRQELTLAGAKRLLDNPTELTTLVKLMSLDP